MRDIELLDFYVSRVSGECDVHCWLHGFAVSSVVRHLFVASI